MLNLKNESQVKSSIVWFKSDLRLHDNETLVRAISSSDEIIPVFCFDEIQFKKTAFGFNKTGSIRVQFLLESLIDLDKNLRNIGSGLIIVIGKPEIEIIKLVKKYNAQKVFVKKEVAYEEIKTNELVEKELWKINCLLESYSTSTLYHAQDLPFTLKDIPDVFTHFRKQVEKESTIRNVFEKPTSIKSPQIEKIALPSLTKLGLVKSNIDPRAVYHFKGGESEGLKRLYYYLFESKSISTYKKTRNELMGENNSSKFSAWLSLGCLSPRQIFNEIKQYENQYTENESTYWLIFELLWRDYFRFMMKKHRHHFFLQNGIKPSETYVNKHDIEKFETWENGQTDNDLVNASMIELKRTGYLSNRARQIVASYLCYELKLDWRYGAAYFEQQLIDYDVCSNWGNWAYIAGVGNDPRGGRLFNTEKQSNEYDKKNSYRDLWLK